MLKQKLIMATLVGLLLGVKSAAGVDEERRAIEENRSAAIAAYQLELAERQKRLDKERAERTSRRAKEDHERQCQFKPVMTAEDLSKCKAVYR